MEVARQDWWIIAALLVHVALLAYGATEHSPSLDEVGHMAAGVSHWKFAHFDLYRVNPPLVRLVATLPVVLNRPATDWGGYSDLPTARPEFGCGSRFVALNSDRWLWLFTIARWACIPFSLLGAGMCYLWGRDLYGPTAGRLACLLWCFSPTIIGQAQMITPDTGATAFGLAAAYAFWKWIRTPDFSRASVAGIILGLTFLTKGTWIILFGAWPLLWLMWKLTDRPGFSTCQVANEFLQGVWMFVLALYVLNLGYGFERSFEQLQDLRFVSRSLSGEAELPRDGANRFANSPLGSIRLPIPANYLLGIDVQKRDFENGFRSYLRGEWKHGGWWYYYLYAWIIKEPLAIWCLALLAMTGRLRPLSGINRPRPVTGGNSLDLNEAPMTLPPTGGTPPRDPDPPVGLRDKLVLYLPAAVTLVLVSFQTGFNHHLRYILPCVPALYIGICGQYHDFRLKRLCRKTTEMARWRDWAVVAGMGWFITSSLWQSPKQLSYFNELVGGPAGGRFHLVDSNLDWGQDLPSLKRWYDAHPEARPFHLAYFGLMDPRVAGIEFSLPPKGPTAPGDFRRGDDALGPQPGWYAISVSTLMGHHYSLADGKGNLEYIGEDSFAYLRRFQPIAKAGNSIFIFHLTCDEVNSVRQELGLPQIP